jgi:beta-lactamase class A
MPPHLSGVVSERTALEAMITRSDNTATDMTIAGGMFFQDRWVYFAFIINWYALADHDFETVNQFF